MSRLWAWLLSKLQERCRHESQCSHHRGLRERNAALEHACRTRPDYDIRCDDCGAAHNLDTSIPSELWNRICRNPGAEELGLTEAGVLCTLCIDDRLVKAGLTCDLAEFYFVGRALTGRLYGAGVATGELQERDRLRAAIVEHHAQRADDRCFLDDDKLYAAAGLPAVDRRVGDKAAMLENCRRFIDRRCEAGGWQTYAELEKEIAALRERNKRQAAAISGCPTCLLSALEPDDSAGQES